MNRIILCAAKAADRSKYRAVLEGLGDKYGLALEIEIYRSGDSLLFALENSRYEIDIIYLDTDLPGTTGISTAKKLRGYGHTCEIIFLASDKVHVLDAFDVGAFHYILKESCSAQQFERIFVEAIKKAEEKHREYICFSGGGESKNIAVHTIKYFEVTNRIITVFYDEDKVFEFYSTMGRLENKLANRGFVRVHRSYLVSAAYIEVLLYGKLKMRDGTEIPVGRSYYQDVKNLLKSKSELQ